MDLKQLRSHIRRGKTFRITLRHPSDRNVFGFPTAASGALLLMREFCDYRQAGWIAVPWGNIASFRSGPFERFSDRVFAGEGISARACPSWLEANSVDALLSCLMRRQRNVIVETADLAAKAAPGENRFYLGRILSVDSPFVSMRTVSALGRWDRRSTQVMLSDIVFIQFDDPYTRIFSKYAPFPAK